MPRFTYTVREYDPERPWIIISTRTGLEVELADAGDFHDWASKTWPSPRYEATLDRGHTVAR